MKQVFQFPASRELRLLDVPAPAARAGEVLVRTVCSALSVGTERRMLEFGAKGIFGKALARPDLVRRFFEVARSEGWLEAYRQARGRLDPPRPLGYSSAGVVLEVGVGVEGFELGDRVACAGSGAATHSELAAVPRGQCVRLPAGVDFESAAFAALGAIVIHNLELAGARDGGRIAVIGLGLLGLLAVQVARARGCAVFATDVDSDRVERAQALGASLAVRADEAGAAQAGRAALDGGADAVVIFAATPSSSPLDLAADIARFRAGVVVPGVVGLRIPRRPFYEKELTLQVSKDWGQGEEARRNMTAFLDLLAQGRVVLTPLITHRFSITDAGEAYRLVTGKKRDRPLGVVLTYPAAGSLPTRTVPVVPAGGGTAKPAAVTVGFIGAGVFARATILPILGRHRDVTLRGVATATGGSAENMARQWRFRYGTTDPEAVIGDADTAAVVIATRHGSHAALAGRALDAGKHVFVEKPLALSETDLRRVWAAHRRGRGRIMVGFNRRFSPFARAARAWLDAAAGPRVVTCRVNAGAAPSDSWIYDPTEGGGRVLGEVCHFVDLLGWLIGEEPIRVTAQPVSAGSAVRPDENLAATLTFADGSLGVIVYTALGDRRFSRERIEAFRGGSVALIENFRSATLLRGGRIRRMRRWTVDRGHRAQFEEFIGAVREARPLSVPFEAYARSTLVTLCLDEALRTGTAVDIRPRWKALESACAC